MRLGLCLAALLLILTSAASAQGLKAENELKALTESIMKAVVKGDLKGAFEKMKPYVPIPDAEFESAALQSRAQRDQFADRFGRPNSYEYIDTKKVGQSLIRIRYIEKTSKTGLPWVFIFYRDDNEWSMVKFNWNADVEPLFCD